MRQRRGRCGRARSPAPSTGTPGSWSRSRAASPQACADQRRGSTGAVVALKLTDAGGALSLEPGWVSHDLSSPATPIIVNGVVFTLATGVPATPTGKGRRGGAPRVRRRDRQAALEQRQGDDDVRVAGQLLERAGADLRRHARRHAATRSASTTSGGRSRHPGRNHLRSCRGSGLGGSGFGTRRRGLSAVPEPQSTMSRCLHSCCSRS